MGEVLRLAVFAAGRVGVWRHIAEADQAALLVLQIDGGGKNDVLGLPQFLGLDLAEDGYAFEVDKGAMSAIGVYGVDGVAGSVVDNAVFDRAVRF